MTSSGTTGQAVSRIYVDRETAMAQQKAMVRILNDYWGKKRLPMLVADTPSVVKDRKTFSARGAAVIGLDIVSRDTVFLLKDDMSLDTGAFEGFLEKYQGQRFILFGFTFLVWKYLYLEMKKRKEQPDLSGAFLMTGGGWKKLEAEAVSCKHLLRYNYQGPQGFFSMRGRTGGDYTGGVRTAALLSGTLPADRRRRAGVGRR